MGILQARILERVAMLSHPNIVAVYDVSHSDELEYIVIKYHA